MKNLNKNLTFLLAPDSFKESLSAKQAVASMQKAIKKVVPNAKCIQLPMADGGEGTLKTLIEATKGIFIKTKAQNAIGKNIATRFGILGDKKTAIIEMALVNGLNLIKPKYRNPLLTSTFGTGQLIAQAIEKGVDKIIICIGGSATNDAGFGMAKALGIKFKDCNHKEIGLGNSELSKLHTVDFTNSILNHKNINIEVACDVNNPLTGENGATYTYAKQKGAKPQMLPVMENNMIIAAKIIEDFLGKKISNIPGAGAAGGLGFGLMAFANATLVKGVDLVLKHTNFEEKVQQADIVFTSEGSIDFQTQFGKVPIGVAQIANKYHKPVIAFAGNVGDISALYPQGITSAFSIVQGVSSLDQAFENAKYNLEKTVENVVKSILINLKSTE